ncbi:MAG: InlB B-repeat-containing protein [Thermomicrobiales bacterium]
MLNLLIPLSVNDVMADGASTEEQSTEQTPGQEGQGITLTDNADSGDEQESASTSGQNTDDKTPETATENTNPGSNTSDENLVVIAGDENPAIEVTPAQPAIGDGNVCVDGTYTPLNVTFSPTKGVTYSDVGEYVSYGGGNFPAVVVVHAWAKLDDGYTWAVGLGNGWTVDGDGTATYNDSSITANPCDANVILAQPVISGNTCIDGVYTPPSITFGPTSGMTYSDVTITEQANGFYSVYAFVADMEPGYGLADGLGSGWAVSGMGGGPARVYRGTIEKTPCEASYPTSPMDPVVTQAVRTDSGAVTPPSVMPATTTGITYTLAGDVAPGSTVTITATPNAGYTLGPATGWTMNGDGTASFVVTLDDVAPSSLIDQIIQILIRILTEIMAGSRS